MNPLSHLPQHKQEELTEIVKVIREVAESAKIILFGNHISPNRVLSHIFFVINGIR